MPDSAGTKVSITEEVTNVSVTNNTGIAVTLSDSTTLVKVNNYAIPSAYQDSANTVFTPYNTITADNVSDALKQLADQNFRGASAPSGSTVDGTSTLTEGDTWYDTDDDVLKLYVQTGGSSYEWQTIQSGLLAATEGGTGLTSIAKGSILAANSANTLSAVDGGGSTDKMLLYTASSDTISWTTDIDGGTY